MDFTLQLVLSVAVAAITVAAAVLDTRSRKIPNYFTVSVFAAGLVFNIVQGAALLGGLRGAGGGLMFSLAGFATGFAILYVLWLIGGGGGGDVKLMAALGSWLGAKLILIVFMISVSIVLVYSVVVLLWRVSKVGFRRTKDKYGGTIEKESEARRVARRLLPYGIPVAIATWCVLAYPFVKTYIKALAGA